MELTRSLLSFIAPRPWLLPIGNSTKSFARSAPPRLACAKSSPASVKKHSLTAPKRGTTMKQTPPTYTQTYDASKRKTFRSSLCHLLQTEFPGVFGPAVTQLFADKIDALYERFHPPLSRFRVGQVFWAAVAVDDPPSRDKRIENTRLVPVVL